MTSRLVTILVLTALLSLAASFASAGSADGLVLHYDFDLNQGGVVIDQSGNGCTGTVHGATWTSDGAPSGAYSFDGNDYINIPFNQNNMRELSYSIWVKVGDTGSSLADSIVISTDINAEGRGLSFDVPSDELVFWTDNQHIRTGTIIETGVWKHVVMTYEPGNNRCYLDGVLIHTDTNSVNEPPYYDASTIKLGIRNQGLYFGYTGGIDDFRVYNRVLTTADIAELGGQPSGTNASGPVLHYTFDNNDGAIVLDQSGNGCTGTVHGATWINDGVEAGAYRFDGGDYIDIPFNQNSMRELSYSIWIKAGINSGGPKDSIIISTDANQYGRGLSLDIPGEEIALWTDDWRTLTGTGAQVDTWHHVALTYTPGDNRCYLDGQLIYTETNSVNEPPYNDASTIKLGIRNQGLYYGYIGALDDFQVYDRILTATEVSALASIAPAETNDLVLYYSFDNDDGTNVVDESGTGNHGVLHNATGQTLTNGPLGKALYFDGTVATHVRTPTSASLEITDEITFSAWVRCDDTTRDAPIIAKEYSSKQSYWFGVFYDAFGMLLDPNGYTWFHDRDNGTVPEGEWAHLVSTWDGSTIRHFINGEILAETSSFTAPTHAGNAFLAIGINSEHLAMKFKGIIDEVRIYHRGLSAAEVGALYDATAPADDLLLYYSFDTDEGGIVTDESGNGHTGTVHGATHSTDGAMGGAYQFDGINDHILGGDLGYIPEGTISFWMNADAVESWRNPFSTDYASWDDCLRFEEDATGQFTAGLGPILGWDVYTTDLQPLTWYHVTFAWTTTGYEGWLNGISTFSGTHNDELYLDFNNVAVGNGYSTSGNRYWKGKVDDVRIYGRVLNEAEIIELAAAYVETNTPPPATNPPPVTTDGEMLQEFGCSDNDDGPWDVTEFMADETIYVRLKDLQIPPNSSDLIYGTLMQGGSQTRVARKPIRTRISRAGLRPHQETLEFAWQVEDDSYLASAPLAKFAAGEVTLRVGAANRQNDYGFGRLSLIYISGTTEPLTVGPMVVKPYRDPEPIVKKDPQVAPRARKGRR